MVRPRQVEMFAFERLQTVALDSVFMFRCYEIRIPVSVFQIPAVIGFQFFEGFRSTDFFLQWGNFLTMTVSLRLLSSDFVHRQGFSEATRQWSKSCDY